MNWEQLVAAFVGSGLGTTIVGLLFKQKIDRNLEIQKAFLDRASREHDRQVDTLAKLYEHLYKAQAFLELMSATARFEGERHEQYPGLFLDSLTSARDELLAGRLLIAPEVVRQCDALLKKLWSGRAELAYARDPMIVDVNQRAQFWDAARKTAYEDIPRLLQEIETSARAVIHGQETRLRA